MGLIILIVSVGLLAFAGKKYLSKKDLLEVHEDYEKVEDEIEVLVSKEVLDKLKQKRNNLKGNNNE